MPTTNGEIQKMSNPEEKLEGIHELHSDIEKETAILTKKPGRLGGDLDALKFWLIHTIMPYMLELAFYAKEQQDEIDQLYEQIELGGGSDETQFTPEHAKKFDLVLQYTIGQTKEMMELAQLTPEQLAIVKTVHDTAAECLKLVEENVIEPGDDGEDEDGEEEEAEQN